MIYRIKELKGDTIPVPQLIFSKLGIAEEYNVRVALYVLATGITDPDKLCADLKLRSRISAESALSFWAGAGLLERYDENAAPGAEPSAPAPMTWAEIAAASRTDPMISSLIDCAQTGFARPLTHSEMEKLVNLYVQEGYAPETVMLCVAYVASRGKRTMAAVLHELKVWRAEGVETGEQADAHLKLLALRQTREQYVASLLGIPDSELTLGGRKAIARWYEVYGYDNAMVQEAAVQAGPKRDLWYWNSILKTWNAKGLRNIHDVRSPVASIGASRNIRVDREAPSGNDFLKNAARRHSLKKSPSDTRYKETLCVPRTNCIRRPCAPSPGGVRRPGRGQRMPAQRPKQPCPGCATPRKRCGCGASAAHWPVRRAGTAPRPPPPLRTPAGSSRSCWRPAAARLTHWNLASPASSARIPAW